MRRKLAGLVGILAVALALGAGVTGHGPAGTGKSTGHQVMADDRGPKFAGT
ncbi:hypothetical protein [Streptomyces bungoensis]|uniref:hypothetical protein n=1 Tax=Streptomyces bungoensis TaxID=285568 RepID=UPI000AAE7A62|nr:hypothetical protein [Streptomyces bungoensis]